MNFGLLLPHLPGQPQAQESLHPDVTGARERAHTTRVREPRGLAIRSRARLLLSALRALRARRLRS